jgi:hypothetical protein
MPRQASCAETGVSKATAPIGAATRVESVDLIVVVMMQPYAPAVSQTDHLRIPTPSSKLWRCSNLFCGTDQGRAACPARSLRDIIPKEYR